MSSVFNGSLLLLIQMKKTHIYLAVFLLHILHSSVQCHSLVIPPPDHGVIRSNQVFDAMLATDRGLYSTDYPYADSPQSIGIHFSHLTARMVTDDSCKTWCCRVKAVSIEQICAVTPLWFFLIITGYRATISAPHMASNKHLTVLRWELRYLIIHI